MRYLILVAFLLCLPVRGEAWQVVGSVSHKISVADDFNRENGTSVDTTGNWTNVHEPEDDGGVIWKDLMSWNNAIAGYSNRTHHAYWSADTFGADQKVCGTVVSLGNAGPAVRILDSTGINAYAIAVEDGNYTLKKFVNTPTAISSTGMSVLATFGAQTITDTICLSVSGVSSTTLTFSVNGVDQTSYVDSSSPITSGQPGWLLYSNTGQYDNWTADEL